MNETNHNTTNEQIHQFVPKDKRGNLNIENLDDETYNIAQSIIKNKKYNPINFGNVKCLKKLEDVINSFSLRGYVYSLTGYGSGFDIGEYNIEFDNFDTESASFGFFIKNEIIASMRIVLDSNKGLPSEAYVPEIDALRKNGNKIAEVGRTVILPQYQKNPKIISSFLTTAFLFAKTNNIDKYVYGASFPIMNMYENHIGGSIFIKDNVQYGNCPVELFFRGIDIDNMNPDFTKKLKRLQERCQA